MCRAITLAYALLDADDLWVEDKLTRQMAALADDPKLDKVFGYIRQFYSPELDEDVKTQIKIPVEFVYGIDNAHSQAPGSCWFFPILLDDTR